MDEAPSPGLPGYDWMNLDAHFCFFSRFITVTIMCNRLHLQMAQAHTEKFLAAPLKLSIGLVSFRRFLHPPCTTCTSIYPPFSLPKHNQQPGANPNPDDCPNNWTPLHAAVDSNRSDVVRLLLEAGADTNAARIEDGWTPLHFAARKSNVKIVPGQAGRRNRPFSMRIGERPFFIELIVIFSHNDRLGIICADTPGS